jgi:hypothetical protein|tara:strand:+ start:2081 stop:2242 length:162 start_codon:yes stop_codon:yes gene_type:complete
MENLIVKIVNNCTNDINEYLMNDSIPMECYQEDIDKKLKDMKEEILEVIANLE